MEGDVSANLAVQKDELYVPDWAGQGIYIRLTVKQENSYGNIQYQNRQV